MVGYNEVTARSHEYGISAVERLERRCDDLLIRVKELERKLEECKKKKGEEHDKSTTST